MQYLGIFLIKKKGLKYKFCGRQVLKKKKNLNTKLSVGSTFFFTRYSTICPQVGTLKKKRYSTVQLISRYTLFLIRSCGWVWAAGCVGDWVWVFSYMYVEGRQLAIKDSTKYILCPPCTHPPPPKKTTINNPK